MQTYFKLFILIIKFLLVINLTLLRIKTRKEKNSGGFESTERMQIIGEVATGIAHDFNNILTAIIGFSEILLTKNHPGDPSFFEILQIKENALRAAGITKNILHFASNKATDGATMVNPYHIIKNMMPFIQKLIHQNIKIKFNAKKNIKTNIFIDQHQFEQIIMNLAFNARDAIKDLGEIEISLSHKSVSNALDLVKNQQVYSPNNQVIKPNQYLILKIKDSGCGIDANLSHKIFNPFFSTKETGKGTGLGLSIVLQIINKNNGYIFYTSQKNIGTTFYILFPSFETTQKTNLIPKQDQLKPKIIENLTILVVEDNDSVRMFINEALKMHGYKTFCTHSPKQAIKIFNKEQIGLIITDISMNEMNGYELINELKSLNPTKNFKVLYISGELNPINSSQYLEKPFKTRDLFDKINEIVSAPNEFCN
jgi:two-component system cell cycle sensor histidine kinase/response regulator CckA